jgi:CysZ protein
MSYALDAPAPPFGVLRRAAAGAWHVPGGIVFLLRRPRLWLLALLPALAAGASVLLGAVFGLYAAPRLESGLLDAPQGLSPWLYTPLAATLWIVTLMASMAAGLGLALLVAAPILDRLSRQTEAIVCGGVKDASRGLGWEIAQTLRGALHLLAAAPVAFLIGLVPIAGVGLGALWAAAALALQETDPVLARRGLTFAERREWQRRYRPESLGFGLAALLLLLVPCANLALAPAIVVGATRLVLELEALAVLP